jgi:23S rRNA pseudouridine2457 synthase
MARELLYFLIHKPFGVLSQFSDEDGNPGLGSLFQLPKDVYPVGRLDMDSEGLLILTNDKALNHKLLNPDFAHPRMYWAQVEGVPDRGALRQLGQGVEINLKGTYHITRPAKARILTDVEIPERNPPINHQKHPVTSWLELTLTEGKNRQVRRMTAAMGHPTLRLVRVAIGDITLGNMKPGELSRVSGKVLYRKLGITT